MLTWMVDGHMIYPADCPVRGAYIAAPKGGLRLVVRTGYPSTGIKPTT